MGFFSSRKAEGDNYFADDKSVVKVIRSRFYGKSKNREQDSETSASTSARTPYSPTFGKQQRGGSPLRREHGREHSSPSPHRRIPNTNHVNSNTSAAPRPTSDAITMTLTQRLNELAVANSEGLLNDDEYRLLRQNLFERFASGTTVPTEKPIVPLGGHLSRSDGRPSPQGQPSSNFHINHPRSPSIRSKASVGSTMSNLFRRATHRQSTSLSRNATLNDSSSILSISSSTSNTHQRRLPRLLTRQPSDASIRTETSRSPFDTISISSRRTGVASDYSSSVEPSGMPHNMYRTASRSTKRLATPPSSYPSRGTSIDTKTGFSGNLNDIFDEDNLNTTKEIRQQIELVEAEGRRLLDAFNGLELSTLTRRQHQQPTHLGVTTSPSSEISQSTSTLVPRRKKSLRRVTDNDSISVQSIASTIPSTKSTHPSERLRPLPSAPLISRPVSLRRKNSVSSVSSRGKAPVPSVPPLPSPLGRLRVGSSSSVNLTRSNVHLPLATVSESGSRISSGEDPEISALETEMADIRRRRAEVTGRYEARLEYLRAKLKGAELHEKLLRK